MKFKLTLLFAVLFLTFTSNSQIRYLKGVLEASQETSPVTSSASGIVIIKYDMATRVVQLHGNYRNLTSAASASHIHNAGPGLTAPPLFNLTNSGGTTGTLSGSFTITVVQEAYLLAGNMYVNVHSATYPGGEIRAQLTTTTDGQTEYLTAPLQGAQATPPNSSAASGAVYVLVDKTTHELFLTGSYSGLTTAASNAHIHTGAPNMAGGVLIPLIFTAAITGTLDTSAVISVPDETSIITGNTYVNIHTSTYPAGEIRGQLRSQGQVSYFANALEGAQEFPANVSAARGTVIVKYNSVTNLLELVGDYQNLSATVSGSHIHGPADPGANAPVLYTVSNTGGTTGTLTLSATLTALEEAELLDGKLYVNVHSTGTYAAGEIRAQLLPTSDQTHYFSGLLEPGQSVATPAVVSSGTGTATVLLDRLTLKVYVTGDFSGLTSNISNAHIHRGAAGSNGPVAVPLQFAGTTSGNITGTATITTTLADSIINGMSYVNIHTVNYGAGEIRAQLGDLVLPLKLKFFNGYKDRDKIALIWESADETNLSLYEIQQQDVANSEWITKKSVSALNNSSANKYSYSDIPFAGTGNYVYYRLKMVDKDGKYYYSQIIRINHLQSKAALMLLSNPVSNNQLQFTITGISTNKKANISIVDYNGRIAVQTTALIFANNSIPLNKLSAGMYKLIVRVDDIILQQSFIK
ncbi:MAG: CHRD domain-containing protein [Ginsengibacter sp.]